MKESHSIEAIDGINLTEETKFWLDKIGKTENYCHEETIAINQRTLCSKKLHKCVTVFDYIDKVLILLSATSGAESIVSFMSVAGAPVGIASVSFTLICSLTTGIIKNLLGTARSKKKKHDEVLMFFSFFLYQKITSH